MEEAGSQQVVVSEEAVSNLIRLALVCEASKRPIKREDINSLVLGEQNSGKLFKPLLAQANVRLSATFGMKLVPLPVATRNSNTFTVAGRKAATSKRNEIGTSSALTTAYVLTTVVEGAERSPTVCHHRQPERLGLLAIILCIIALSEGGTIEEEALLDRLLSLGIDTTILGDWFSELKKQKYIITFKKSDDMNVTVYCAGPRAQVEFPHATLAAFVVELGELVHQTHQLSERVAASFRLS